MAIPPQVIEQVRQAADIVDVIGGYVPLKRAGANFKALSPFNKEKTPSFFVSPQRQTFKCFSSGHGGDVFKFLMLYENLDFPAAVRRVAEKVGIRVEEERRGGADGDYDRQRRQRDRLLVLHSEVLVYWRELLLHDQRARAARDYMHGREIPQSWIKDFGLGFAPDAWDDTLHWGQEHGYDEALLLAAGLLVRNEAGRMYDRFRGRLIFSIANDQGQPIAFSARLLDKEAKAAKYINSPETPIFTKSKVLFGLHRAKRPIMDEGRAIICEGQIDVLRCHAAGVLNAVAPLGTAFTPEHARIIKRYTKQVVLCLDADKAGLNAAERVTQIFLDQADSMDAMLQTELGVQIVRLPDGHDPDSMITREGAAAFKACVAKPQEYLDFYLDRLRETNDMSAISGRRAVIESAAAFLARVPNRAYREQLLRQTALRLSVSDDILLARVAELERQAKRSAQQTAARAADHERANLTVSGGVAPPARAEVLQPHPLMLNLLQLVAAHPRQIPAVQKMLDPLWVRDLPGAELWQKLADLYNDEGWENITAVLPRLADREQNFLAGLPLEELEKTADDATLAMAGRLVRLLQLNHVQGQLQIVWRQLAAPGLADNDKAALLARMRNLQLQKNTLTART
ncbi:MAG: DNA primase [Verrucomicrobiales bacterium]|jgi:DNA primase|nr:DNA primase [Verrucomicrobiales bacterium]